MPLCENVLRLRFTRRLQRKLAVVAAVLLGVSLDDLEGAYREAVIIRMVDAELERLRAAGKVGAECEAYLKDDESRG